MFGLSKGNRELDAGFIPIEVKLLAVVLFPIVLGLGLLWSDQVEKPTKNDLAFGCYLAGGSQVIRLGADGARLSTKDGPIIVPFKLEFAKGYQIELEGSVELVVEDNQIYWQETARGWSNLLRFVDESSFSQRSVDDHNRLDAFQAVTANHNRVVFDRIPASDC